MSKNKYIPNLFTCYNTTIKKELLSKSSFTNSMKLPKLEKIIINQGFGAGKENSKNIKSSIDDIMVITGQKPIITKAKKAISNFKVRENDPIGLKVTLRRNRMYEFLERFISIASPRIRDFRGLPNNNFDGMGNYNFGINEQIIFPEVDYDKVNQLRGMNITIVTSTYSDDEAYELLLLFGMPIKKRKVKKKENDNNQELKSPEAELESESNVQGFQKSKDKNG